MRARISTFLLKLTIALPFSSFSLVLIHRTTLVQMHSKDSAISDNVIAIRRYEQRLTILEFCMIDSSFFLFCQNVIRETTVDFFEQKLEHFIWQYGAVWLHEGEAHFLLYGIFVNNSKFVVLIAFLDYIQNHGDSFDVADLIRQLSFHQIMVFFIDSIWYTNSNEQGWTLRETVFLSILIKCS